MLSKAIGNLQPFTTISTSSMIKIYFSIILHVKCATDIKHNLPDIFILYVCRVWPLCASANPALVLTCLTWNLAKTTSLLSPSKQILWKMNVATCHLTENLNNFYQICRQTDIPFCLKKCKDRKNKRSGEQGEGQPSNMSMSRNWLLAQKPKILLLLQLVNFRYWFVTAIVWFQSLECRTGSVRIKTWK